MKKLLRYLYGVFFLILLTASIVRLVDLRNYRAKIIYEDNPSFQENSIRQKTKEDGSPYLQISVLTYCGVYYDEWDCFVYDGVRRNSFAVKEAIVEYTVYDWKNKTEIATFQADGTRYVTKDFDYVVEDVDYIRITRTLVDYKVRYPWTRVATDILCGCVSLANISYLLFLLIRDIKRHKESLIPVEDDLYERETNGRP